VGKPVLSGNQLTLVLIHLVHFEFSLISILITRTTFNYTNITGGDCVASSIIRDRTTANCSSYHLDSAPPTELSSVLVFETFQQRADRESASYWALALDRSTSIEKQWQVVALHPDIMSGDIDPLPAFFAFF